MLTTVLSTLQIREAAPGSPCFGYDHFKPLSDKDGHVSWGLMVLNQERTVVFPIETSPPETEFFHICLTNVEIDVRC